MLATQRITPLECTICGGQSSALDVVDFNKSCEEHRGKFLPLSGEPIYYFGCQSCGFCFAPEMAAWEADQFASKVYNEGYAEIDPDYLEARPIGNANLLASLFPEFLPRRHLDYGGGNGLLSRTLKTARWNTISYDPFVNKDVDPSAIGSFDLVSAFEVFEHVPDINIVLETLSYVIRDQGVLLFSTLLSDGSIVPGNRLTWWYASPRNGHVSLFSKDSLRALADRYGSVFVSLTPGLHLFVRSSVPAWVRHLLPHHV